MRIPGSTKRIAFTLATWAAASSSALALTITSIDFSTKDGSSLLEIKGDGPIQVNKEENAQDKQVILEIPGAKLAKSASRMLDTSSFNSKVKLVSSYQVEGSPDTSRIVLQLR